MSASIVLVKKLPNLDHFALSLSNLLQITKWSGLWIMILKTEDINLLSCVPMSSFEALVPHV